jgi:hypothetical protein
LSAKSSKTSEEPFRSKHAHSLKSGPIPAVQHLTGEPL